MSENEQNFMETQGEPHVEEGGASEPEVTSSKAALKANADRDAVINDSLVGAVAAGRDLQAYNAILGGPVAVGRDLTMEQSLACTMVVGNSATLKGSTVGLLISTQGKITLEEGSRVLMTTKQAAVYGAVFGLVFGLISLLGSRRRGG